MCILSAQAFLWHAACQLATVLLLFPVLLAQTLPQLQNVDMHGIQRRLRTLACT
jgi:hypothetical protein